MSKFIEFAYKSITNDVYQEQIKIISDRIYAAEIVLGKIIFDKYRYEDVEKFKDLGKTYIKSEPGERKVLIGSICPNGMSWQYSGLSNQQFSPQYQAILDVREDDFASSTTYAINIEPFLTWIFNLMDAYGKIKKD